MRKVIFKLHLIVAIAAGLFILILGLTGSLMAFEQELDHVLHWHLSYVHPQGPAMSLAQIHDVVGKAYPGGKITGYFVSTAPDLSYAAALTDKIVYVNQYSGEILGTRAQEMDWQGYVHQLHLRLAMLDKGKNIGGMIMSWSGVAAIFLVISGAYLWWPVKRVTISGGGGRRFWFDVHNALGIFSLVFVLLLAITGVIIGFEQETSPILYKLTGSHEAEQPRLEATPVPGALPIAPDQALAIARAAVPGAAPFFVTVPAGKQVYRVSARFPEDLTPGGRTRIAIDPFTGRVIFKIDSRTGPAGYRAVALNRAIHTGDIFGWFSKTVMSLASLIMALQLVSGVVMWLKRRASERKARGATA